MIEPTPDTTAETLRFSHANAALGTLLVAASVRGVAALFIGDDRMRRVRDLQSAFPGARLSASAQEVGAACAANRIAVAVPCQRVVKADGSISGYRWGVQRKRRLINMEGVALWSSICA
ncbi:MAG TPA: methylated-DNA--[protein]-cysteine S-methyltransferase [Steroidobacteraceae bacterium]|jgi:hypothetical protein|nr:methylated-DNA--[protein]-cysteine S-methyltransferase [Steroidobacteraceae bacterium]